MSKYVTYHLNDWLCGFRGCGVNIHTQTYTHMHTHTHAQAQAHTVVPLGLQRTLLFHIELQYIYVLETYSNLNCCQTLCLTPS